MRSIAKNVDEFMDMLRVIQDMDDMDEVLALVMEKIRDYIDNERCTLFLLDRETNTLYSKLAQKYEGELRVPVNKKSIAGYCAVTGQELLINDVGNEKELKAIDPELGFCWSLANTDDTFNPKQLLCLPIMHRGEVVGVFEAFNKRGGFIGRNVDAMRDFALLLGVTINRIRDAEELARLKEEKKKVLYAVA